MARNPFYHVKTKVCYALLISAFSVGLAGCGAADRLSSIGKAPELTQIVNPTTQKGYRPVSMPMPVPKATTQQANSLWIAERQTFFKDQRARLVGDILTVTINIKDKAEMDNTSQRSRAATEGAGLDSLLGYEASLSKILPEAVNNQSLAGFNSNSNSRGTGSLSREEDVRVKMAALITQILPNGNLVIQGRQEVRVNYEKRILEITGVIRSEDVATDNSISYEKIAEARISYGGEGHISDVQQPRYGHQLYDILFPF